VTYAFCTPCKPKSDEKGPGSQKSNATQIEMHNILAGYLVEILVSSGLKTNWTKRTFGNLYRVAWKRTEQNEPLEVYYKITRWNLGVCFWYFIVGLRSPQQKLILRARFQDSLMTSHFAIPKANLMQPMFLPRRVRLINWKAALWFEMPLCRIHVLRTSPNQDWPRGACLAACSPAIK